MPSKELKVYLERVGREITLGLYISRRFTTATIEGGADPDLGYQWRGVLREGEPGLNEILRHPRVVILGEPGLANPWLREQQSRKSFGKVGESLFSRN